jgi:RimJ/RimL family protein N-acetyltransferase
VPDTAPLAARLPDIPRLVETRAMLLGGAAAIHGDADGGHYVVSEDDLAAIVGRPSDEVVRAAVAGATAVRSLLVMCDALEDARRALPRWTCEEAVIHALPAPPPPWPHSGPDVRFLDAATPLDHLTRALADEIACALRDGPVTAAWCEGRPAAFCYASSATESLWDVSIDTVPAYRRRGLAQSAVYAMAAHQREEGREPVWGALVGNEASLRHAARLGIVTPDRLFVFTRPD